jgi:hypothetical protein
MGIEGVDFHLGDPADQRRISARMHGLQVG